MKKGSFSMVTNINGGLTVDGVPVGNLSVTGRVFYLDGSIGTNNLSTAGTAAYPFDTGAFALTACSANRGDVIIVGKGHDQSLATLLALNTVAGVTFIDTRYNVSWTTGTPGANRAVSNRQSVSRLAALLTSAAPNNIFTVVGSIRVIEIYGLVEVVIANTACTVRLGAVATGLTEFFMSAASASVAAAAVGTTISITGTVADAAILSANQNRLSQALVHVVHTGVIRITNSGSPATGTVSWHMLYEPVTPGSYAIAA
jgi:hypothetical protein